MQLLYGEHNAHIRHIEQALGIHIADRGNTLTLEGDDEAVTIAERVLDILWDQLHGKKSNGIESADIDAALRFVRADNGSTSKGNGVTDHGNSQDKSTHDLMEEDAAIKTRRKRITPRSPNQASYMNALRAHDLVFGIGPGGTGKTYLAVGAAVEMFEKGHVERMIFCRPAVEAGEKLGFLPGDMREKIDPYLRPIYDALNDFLDHEKVDKLIERGAIEIAPLAFMRGRTLSSAFVVLDEAQNTTSVQMKMFLSRMGEHSRMVVTGDPEQSDLPRDQVSGLREALDLLESMDGVAITTFDNRDVVRHKLVGRILKAYEKAGHGRKG